MPLTPADPAVPSKAGATGTSRSASWHQPPAARHPLRVHAARAGPRGRHACTPPNHRYLTTTARPYHLQGAQVSTGTAPAFRGVSSIRRGRDRRGAS